jgi:hypothetical protein
MEIRMESEEQMAARGRKKKQKGRRPDGPVINTPRKTVKLAGEDMCRREREWLDRLAKDPASFAEVELEVHARLRLHADLFVAGLLSRASEGAAIPAQVQAVLEEAETPLRAVEKKDGR